MLKALQELKEKAADAEKVKWQSKGWEQKENGSWFWIGIKEEAPTSSSSAFTDTKGWTPHDWKQHRQKLKEQQKLEKQVTEKKIWEEPTPQEK